MKLEINYRNKTVKNTNTWRLNNTFLNNRRNEKEIKKFLETSGKENMTTHNLGDAAKAVLRGKFIAIHSYLKKQEKHRTDSLTLHLKQMEKEQKKKKLGQGKKS